MLEFDSIYRRYWPDVLRFSLYLCGNMAEAEDRHRLDNMDHLGSCFRYGRGAWGAEVSVTEH